MTREGRDNDDRRKIEELISIYELHPEFRDIYVEGDWDRRLVNLVLKHVSFTGVSVYDVDDVDISSETLEKHGLPRGKKSRVVALARELEEHVANRHQVTCMADRDYDVLMGISFESPLLLMTDFSCQECYLLAGNLFDKFLAFVAEGYPLDGQNLLAQIAPVLKEFHLIRAANLSLGMELQWLPFASCMTYANHELQIDYNLFLYKYLNKSAKLAGREALLQEIERLRVNLSAEFRHHVTKDDLFALLAEVLSRYTKAKPLRDSEYLGRALACCIDFTQLIQQPMYQALLNRVKAENDPPTIAAGAFTE